MSIFHTTISRREFMKNLGLAGAGIGAASLVVPSFHDLDEALTSSQVNLHRAWYIKKRDFGDIGIELDWNLIKRRDMREFANWNMDTFEKHYPGGPQANKNHLADCATKNKAKHYQVWPNAKDPTTRDYALRSALASVNHYTYYTLNCAMGGVKVNPAKTPEQLGMPKWEGTPEENSLMIRAAFSIVGLGPSIAVSELDEKTKNFVWDYAPRGWLGESSERLVFDDTITSYVRQKDPPTLRIPTSHKYVISTHNMSSDELFRRSYTIAGSGNPEHISYNRVGYAKNFVEEFIRGLGYHCVYGHSIQPAAIWDFLGGGGEHCRMGQISLSPEYGGLRRTHAIFFTDLPLAFTPPINAGLTKFCETCGICADACPMGAIPPAGIGRSWDPYTGQNWSDDKENGGTEVMYNLPGYKGWRLNLFECAYTPCTGACKAQCPFNAIPGGSFIHNIVKGTVATTPMFNTFFKNMEQTLKYGIQEKDHESWWHEPEAWHIYGSNPNLLRQ
ncbi:MAG: reductive dehalogenase [Dehalogenimonas sp.]